MLQVYRGSLQRKQRTVLLVWVTVSVLLVGILNPVFLTEAKPSPQNTPAQESGWNDTFDDTTKIEYSNNLTVSDGDVKLFVNEMPSWATVYFIDVASQNIDLDVLKIQLEADNIAYTDNTNATGLPTFDGTTAYIHQVERYLNFSRETSIEFINHSVYVSSSEIVIGFSDDFTSPNDQNLFRECRDTSKMSTSTIRVPGFIYGTGGPSPAYVLDETLDYTYTHSGGAVTSESTFSSTLIDKDGYMLQAVTNDYGLSTSTSWVHFDFTGVPGQNKTVVKAWLKGSAMNAVYDLEYPEGTWYNTFVNKDVTAETRADTTPRLLSRDSATWNRAAGGTVIIIGNSTTLPTETHSFPDQSGYDWADELFITSLKMLEPIKFGNMTSTKIIHPSGYTWESLNISKTEPSAENNITVSILNGSTGAPITGYTNMSGTDIDISGISASLYPSIKLLANFSGNVTATPILHEWEVNWIWDGNTPLINHTAITSANVSEVINITANVTDNVAITGVTLCYKNAGDTFYTNISMVLTSGNIISGNWSADIPAQTTIGMAYYYINATDGVLNSSHPSVNPSTDPHAITIYDVTPPEISHTPLISVIANEFVEITAQVTDNIDVDDVRLFYYFDTTGGPTLAQNESMNDQGGDNYNYTVNVPANALILHYNISANDTSNNWNETGEINVDVIDNIAPQIFDTTTGTPTTGDSYTITALVTDNIGVDEVHLYYQFDTTTGLTTAQNVSMSDLGGGNYDYPVSVPLNALIVYYNISAKDASNIWNETGLISRGVQDNDPPQITDNTVATPTTGDDFTIYVNVNDYFGVGDVYLYYYFTNATGFTPAQKETMNDLGGGNYDYHISVLDDAVTLYYNISANDTNNNWGETGLIFKAVQDNDPPQIADTTTGTLTVGETFMINATVSDNIDVDVVNLSYYFNTTTGPTTQQNISMTDLEGGNYNHTIFVPSNTLTLYYNISANDTSNNWNDTGEILSFVEDNVRPQIFDLTPPGAVPTTGDDFTITVMVTDNIAVDGVYLNHQFLTTTGLTSWQNVSMNDIGSGNFNFGLSVPSNSLILYYYIAANDTSDNWNITDAKNIGVVDNDVPLIIEMTGTPNTGEGFAFSVTVTDNIAMDEVLLYYYFDTTTGLTAPKNVTMNILGGGNYNHTLSVPASALALYYNISANDTSNNWNETGLNSITVYDNDSPTADAGEYLTVGEATTVTINASGSTDNIGIVNYTWNFTYNATSHSLYGMIANFTFFTPGNYSITLTIKDAAGNSDTDNQWVNVTDTTNPIADARSNIQVSASTLVIFNGSGSTDNVAVTNYTWTFTHNGTVVTLYGVSPQFRFWTPGTYTVTLMVTDADGNWNTDSMAVSVSQISGDGAGEYWWIILLILIIVIVTIFVAYLFIRKSSKPEEPQTAIFDSPPTRQSPEEPIPFRENDILGDIERRFAEGHISEETYNMLRQRYGGGPE